MTVPTAIAFPYVNSVHVIPSVVFITQVPRDLLEPLDPIGKGFQVFIRQIL